MGGANVRTLWVWLFWRYHVSIPSLRRSLSRSKRRRSSLLRRLPSPALHWTCYHGVLDYVYSFKRLTNHVGYIIVKARVARDLWQRKQRCCCVNHTLNLLFISLDNHLAKCSVEYFTSLWTPVVLLWSDSTAYTVACNRWMCSLSCTVVQRFAGWLRDWSRVEIHSCRRNWPPVKGLIQLYRSLQVCWG